MAEADWILQARLPDGALAVYVDKLRVVPYWSNYSAMGLARASVLTGRREYANAAWSWLAWYAARQDENGFVADYMSSADGMISTGDMDSTDAYAATFLLATEEAWMATRDKHKLRTLAPAIAAAVRAVEATLDRDGMTWAKPSWQVKYLMDQSEVYAGLRAAERLADILHLTSLAARTALLSGQLAWAVATLWNPTTGSYDWALSENGTRASTTWTVLYPDAASQVWPVATGLATGSRARDLMAHFEHDQPGWSQPLALDPTSSGRVGYWVVAAWAQVRIGDIEAARAARDSIVRAATHTDRAWPYTPAVAAQLIVLDSALAGGTIPAR